MTGTRKEGIVLLIVVQGGIVKIIPAMVITSLSIFPALAQLLPKQTSFVGEIPANTIILTFDDGFELGYFTVTLAQFLRYYKTADGISWPIKATFFINGCRFVNTQQPNRAVNPFTGNCFGFSGLLESQLQAVVDLGHELANHTYDHVDYGAAITDEERKRQVLELMIFISRFQKTSFYFFRAPDLDWKEEWAELLNGDPAIKVWNPVGPVTANYMGVGTAPNGRPVNGDWDCLKDNSPQGCAQIYVKAILDNPCHCGIVLIHDRQPFVGASNKPQEMVEWILKKLPPDRFQYKSLGEAYREILRKRKKEYLSSLISRQK